MLDAALKALEQLLSPPFRAVLLKSIALALVLLLALVVYLVALPFLLLAGVGAIIFFIATAFLLGRVYFELAAMRFHSVTDAKRLRKARQGSVFVAGLLIAAFVSIPIVNLATPLFGMALMVHLHKRLTSPRGRLIENTG
jgi:CysZ protein